MLVLRAQDREQYPQLFEQIYRGRAAVFHERLRWPVSVVGGLEIDHYDRECDPVYILDLDPGNRVRGSLRLLPSTGVTMLNREFVDFFDEPVDVKHPLMWECTKFCVHPTEQYSSGASRRLLIGLLRLCMDNGVSRVIGLYETQMERVYARIGWEPIRLATCKPDLGNLAVGVWSVGQAALTTLQSRSQCTLPEIHFASPLPLEREGCVV